MPSSSRVRASDGVVIGKKHRANLKEVIIMTKQQERLENALDKEIPFLPKDVSCGMIPMCLPASTAVSSKKAEDEDDSDSEQEDEKPSKTEKSDEKTGKSNQEGDDQSKSTDEESKKQKSKDKTKQKEGKKKTATDSKATVDDTSMSQQPSKSQSFWARWGRGATSSESASLQTGRGNKAVSRSLRDAREDAVCLVRSGSKVGSGFLVEFKRQIGVLTNNHVLPTRKEARGATATFNTASKGSVEVQLLPKEGFYSSLPELLDYSFIACESPAGVFPVPMAMRRADTEDDAPGSGDGLVCIEDMIVRAADTVTIVQHPDGGEKSIAIGPVLKIQGSAIFYEADTEMGSSGSPVLKDYVPVALHHCAPRGADARGGLLASVSCAPVRKMANKGILLSAILMDLDAKMPIKGSAEDVVEKTSTPAATSGAMGLLERMGLSGMGCGGHRKADKEAKDVSLREKATKDEGEKEGEDEEEEEEEEEEEKEEGKNSAAEKSVGKKTEKESEKKEKSEVRDDDDEVEEEEEEHSEDDDEADNDKNGTNKSNGMAGTRKEWSRMCGVGAMSGTTPSGGKVSAKSKDRMCGGVSLSSSLSSADSNKSKGKERSFGAVLYASMPSLTAVPQAEQNDDDNDDENSKGESSSEEEGKKSKARRGKSNKAQAAAKAWRKDIEKETGGVDGWAAVSEEDEIMIKAGLAGLGVVADGVRAAERAEMMKGGRGGGGVKKGGKRRGAGGDGLENMQCGVGLVLESWKPRGLALALNVLARTHEAVRVDQVVAEGPAARANPRIEPGDLIREVDSIVVTSLSHAKQLLVGKPGTSVTIRLMRNQYPLDVTVIRNVPGAPPVEVESVSQDQVSASAGGGREGTDEDGEEEKKETKKYVKGIPQLYKRGKEEKKKRSEGGGGAKAKPRGGGGGGGKDVDERSEAQKEGAEGGEGAKREEIGEASKEIDVGRQGDAEKEGRKEVQEGGGSSLGMNERDDVVGDDGGDKANAKQENET